MPKSRKKELREKLYKLLIKNELCNKETKAISYRGFDVIFPSEMVKYMPFVYIENNGQCRIEIGLAKNGILTRIDNYIDNFEKRLETFENSLKNLQKRRQDITEELPENQNYSDKIRILKDRIREIDKELGVRNEQY